MSVQHFNPTRYPNIQEVLDHMTDDTRSMAALYFAMIPYETIEAIERAIPEFITAYHMGDTERIQELADSIGVGELGPQLVAFMAGADGNAIA